MENEERKTDCEHTWKTISGILGVHWKCGNCGKYEYTMSPTAVSQAIEQARAEERELQALYIEGMACPPETEWEQGYEVGLECAVGVLREGAPSTVKESVDATIRQRSEKG